MYSKFDLDKLAYGSKEDVVKFDENFQFTLVPECLKDQSYIFRLKDFKGEFEIEKIVEYYSSEKILYDKEQQSFKFANKDTYFRFYITSYVHFTEVDYVKVEHSLKFNADRLALLDKFDYYASNFELTGYEHIKFKAYVRKYDSDKVTLVIENPYNIRINDNKGEYKCDYSIGYGINSTLSFVFDPSTWNATPQIPLTMHSRPVSVMTNVPVDDESKQKPNFFDSLIDSSYADAIFVASDGKKIPSHRCILAKISPFFYQKLRKARPIELDASKYNAKTIEAAMNFCYGKDDKYFENEDFDIEVAAFGFQFDIKPIKESFTKKMLEELKVSNVIEVVKVAYHLNIDSLKQKCKSIMNENKEKLCQAELKALPYDIIFDIFCAL